MYIEVARIPPEGQNLAGDDESVFADQPPGLGFEASGPVSYDFHLNYVCGELIVVGSLSVSVSFPCSRCANAFSKEIRAKRFDFVSEAPDGTESVDLTAEMREAILCAFPSHPVCRKECKGLCSQCGKDLNEGECECVPAKDNRWGALGGLKL